MIERVQGTTEARDLLLRRAVEYLDSLAREAGGDAQLQGELAAGYEKIGDLQGNPSNPNLVAIDEAIDSYSKARRSASACWPPPRRPATNAARWRTTSASAATSSGRRTTTRRRPPTSTKPSRSYEALLAEHPGDVRAVACGGPDPPRHRKEPVGEQALRGRASLLRTAITMGRAMGQSAPRRPTSRGWWAIRTRSWGLRCRGKASRKRPRPRWPARPRSTSRCWRGTPTTRTSETGCGPRTGSPAASTRSRTTRAQTSSPPRRWQPSGPPPSRTRPTSGRASSSRARISRLGQTAINNRRPAEAVGHLERLPHPARDPATGSKNGRLRSELALALTRLAEATWAQGQTRRRRSRTSRRQPPSTRRSGGSSPATGGRRATWR